MLENIDTGSSWKEKVGDMDTYSNLQTAGFVYEYAIYTVGCFFILDSYVPAG